MKDDFYSNIGGDFIYSLTNESSRGAVLIGASKVEEYLEKLIILILPKREKKYKEKLLNYPGPISSFSSKIELSFAFRLIDLQLYNSLNVLRKIRNIAAHTANNFKLNTIKQEINSIICFEPNFDEVVKSLAYDDFVKIKKHQMREAIKNVDVSQKIKDEILEKQFKYFITSDVLLDQLVIWQLAYGLSFICLKLLAILDDYGVAQDRTQTWIEIMENKSI